MISFFFITNLLHIGDRELFDVPVAEQFSFIDSLREPTDGIERSYLQFRCHMFFSPSWKRVLFSMISICVCPVLLLSLWVRGFFTRVGEPVTALMECNGMESVVPLSVRDKYKPDVRFWKHRASLTTNDIIFVLKVIRVGFLSPYFVFRTLVNTAFYSDMIRSHKPSAIIAFMEYSYSSSLLTEFCHAYSVSHINVMHGEKLFFIRDSFFWFDECYVWDQHYIDLFLRLRAESSQFRIEIPPSLSVDIARFQNIKYYADYKYYLAEYNEEQIASIVASMRFVKRDGKTLRYRPHPRYSNLRLLQKYVPNDEIEYPDKVSIEESVANMSCAVGCFTTVLLQAYMVKKDCILDDVTFKDQCDKLVDYDYILATADIYRLSLFQN